MEDKKENYSPIDDKKALRFTEDEKHLLFTLFTKYKDIIDIKHRRHSSSQHKQTELRKCWDAILDAFNEQVASNKRTLKQIQKFWLNSKLRKRLPGDKDIDKSPSKRQKTDIVEVKIVKAERTSNAAFQALVKTCKDSDIENDDEIDEKIGIETCHEVDVPNVSAGDQYEEEQYDPLSDSYFPNDAITLKVINDQMGLELATPNASSIVTIPAQTSRTLIHGRTDSSSASTSATPQTAAYITYSPQTTATIGSQNIQLVKSSNGNYLITTPAQQHISTTRSARTSQASPITISTARETDHLSNAELQRQELVYRYREAKLRCEIQEAAKEKAKEELLQLREIHRMKIKEMEMRLRNMERS